LYIHKNLLAYFYYYFLRMRSRSILEE